MVLHLRKILCSSCRQEILTTLAKRGPVSIMNLVKYVNSTWNEVNRNLHVLEKEGIILQHRVGNKRIVTLNRRRNKTQLLLKALKTLDQIFDTEQTTEDESVPPFEWIDGNSLENTNQLHHPTTPANGRAASEKTVQLQREFPVPDCLTLMKIPQPLRKTVLSLYKVEKATSQELAKENGRSRNEESAIANQLHRLGYIGKKKEGNKVYFYLDFSNG